MNANNFPIRILHVFGIMNCGGAETFIMNVYRNIDREKVQFDFIVHSQDEGYYDDEIKSLGGVKYVVPKFKGTNLIDYKKSWKFFFDTHSEYRIIHSHIRSTASIFLKIAKRQGLKTIIHSHSTSSGSGFSAYVKDLLQLPLRDIADYRFACSTEAGKWLFRKRDFNIVKNGINSEEYIYNMKSREYVREKLGLDGKFVIGHIGRFNEPKNHFFIVDIFKTIHEMDPKSALLLVGEGDLRLEVENRINELNLQSNVIFTGIRSDIPELLHAMDVFLFPSLYEGLGIVVIEAQAAGLPCVVSDTVPEEVAITDLVDFFSLRKSEKEWSEQIMKYIGYGKRLDTSEKIKKSGYEINEQVTFLEKFYLDNMVVKN
ncbi:glycosyl transferase family 1 [Paenibacillus odorifer]|uniref:glycosyltransferase family 1 protein n=1 Tax=Paenibacillus odorifer TaxID=189426 RepID=UPI00096CF819|nr:glycosyltransferase family 1 protein [Paenibacillus odorifer]OMD74813.1 glycosyl transferase family 1 [Paenibacillus odorifer]OME03149.1 glycosyl transferase family 1 [Paenibacillus odorifer]